MVTLAEAPAEQPKQMARGLASRFIWRFLKKTCRANLLARPLPPQLQNNYPQEHEWNHHTDHY